MEEIDNWQKAIRSDQDPIQATSLNELASKLEVDQDALVKTLNTFNAACPKDLSIFNAKRPDGLATLGLEPRKSHWARPIDKPPYLAWPIISAVCFTFGGLKTNAEAQVLNMDGDVIPGLYAAGETMGIYYQTYTGATSVMRGAVFGRKAGSDAANRYARANTL
jgi:tricarballylate dehydrogenase